jgi:protocadherin Fat 4
MSLRNFLRHTRLLIQQGLYETRKINHVGHQRALELTRLEERVLFSASAVAPVLAEVAQIGGDLFADSAPADDLTAFHVPDQQLLDLVANSALPAQADALNGNSATDQQTLELVFLDSSISNLDQMIADLQSENALDPSRTLEIVILDSSKDGIAQITSALLNYNGVDGMHIVSHGTDGQVQLGSTTLSLDNLDRYRSAISAWQYSMSDKADLLFYGCDLAASADGRQLLSDLSQLTQSLAEVSSTLNHEVSSTSSDEIPPVVASTDVVLIDTQLQDSSVLIGAVNSGAMVFTYDGTSESATSILDRVTDWAQQSQTDIRTLSILSHGVAGGFELGNQWITTSTFDSTAADWKQLSEYFVQDADIYILGCDVGAVGGDGQQLLDKLAFTTSTEVYASDDITGVGGDWMLEIASAGNATLDQAALGHVFDVNGLQAANVSLAWYNASWGYRQSVTINESMVTGSSNLTNFAVLVSVTDANLKSTSNGGHVGQTDGGDFVFTSADGTTKLDHQIESYNAATGTLVAWVEVPSLSYNVNTGLYLYYGNAGVADQWNFQGTWDASTEAVYHLDTFYIDSTSNANNGTNSGGTNLASSKIGAGETFNGTNAKITVADSNSLDITSALTVSGWFNSSNLSSYKAFVSKGTSTTGLNYYVATKGTELEFEYYNGSLRQFTTSGLGLTTGTWYHFATTYDDASDTIKMYLNGSQVYSNTSATTAMVSNSTALTIGTSPWNEWYNGSLDEIRIDSTARSADWIQAQYLNQDSPGSYVAVAGEEVVTPLTNIVPGSQSTNEDTSLIFSSGNGNQISISDDPGTSLEVTLSVTNGMLTLSGTSGLTFSTGDGTSDATMTFAGTVENINTALNGLSFNPTANYNGGATLTIDTSEGSSALDVDAALDGRYTFDNTGALGTDDSGNGNTGSVVGATAFNDPTRGQVLSFDGSDYVQISGHLGNPPNLTLAGWVKLTTADSNGSEVISIGDSASLRVDESGKLEGVFYNGSTWTVTSYNVTLAGTGWHHVAYSFNDTGNVAKLYLDGVEVASTTTFSSIDYSLGANTFVGKHGNGGTTWDFTGLIDDARIYTRALSAAEVTELATTGTPETDTDNVAITVNAVNDAPTISNGYTYSLTGTNENTTSSGTLASSILTGASWADVDTGAVKGLAITGKSGNGTWQYSTDGTTWNSFGSVSSTNALLITSTMQVRYIPDGNNGETATFSYKAWDQTSGTASDNATARYATTASSGGTTAFSSNNASAQIIVTSVNDAPTISSGSTYSLTGTNENTTSSGTLASSILTGASWADVDTGAVKGLAITGKSGNGTWQYSTDGTTWNSFGSVSSTNALLITSTTQVRYIPDGNNGETATFSYKAWDQTSGTASDNATARYATTASSGGTTAFSSNNASAQIIVTSVNDAPTISSGSTYSLTGTNENTTSSGTLASSILTGASWADVDTGAVKGLAITGKSGNGTWQYSTDGTTWNSFGSVSSTNALLITSTTQVRYIPDGNNGETATFSYKAWDQTSGTASDNATARYATTASSGGTTAFSSNNASAQIIVTSVNDAPVLDNSGFMSLTTITEDDTSNSGNTVAQIIASAGGDRITDPDSGALEGIAISGVTGSNGTWQYNTGSGWTDVGSVSSTSALLLRATDSLRFVPNGLNGDTGTVLFQAWDQTSGTAGTKVDSSVSGGATAFSTQLEAAVITVTSVNDAPSGTDKTITFNEDTTYVLTAADFGFTDPDGNSFNRVWIMSLPGQGLLLYNGSTFAANNWILKSDIDLGLLTFEPVADANGAGYATFDFQVQDDGGTANGGVNRDATSNTITIDVTAVNDAPIIHGTAASAITAFINEFHYDNAGTDSGEGIEIAGLAGTDLTGWKIEFYNGNGGTVYRTENLSGILADQGGGFGTTFVALPSNGMQNDDEAIALVDNFGKVVEFLSYEGTLVATDGAAIGMTSTDIGVAESSVTPVGASIQRTGMGPNYTWTYDVASSFGSINAGQTFVDPEFMTETVAEDSSLVYSAANGNAITISDIDADAGASDPLSVTLTADNGTLTLGSTFGLTSLSGNGTGTVTLHGSVTEINAALDGLTYQGIANFNGSDFIHVTVDDQGNTGTGGSKTDTATFDVVVTPVNDAPTIVAPAGPLSAVEQTPLDLHSAGFIFDDVDSNSGILQVTLSVGEGTLTVTEGDSGVIIISGNGTGTVILTGSIIDLDNLFGNGSTGTIVYLNSSNTPSASTNLTVIVNDQGNSGTDPGLTADANSEAATTVVAINITTVNDDPVASHGGTYAINEGEVLNLDASGTTDPDGNSLTYRWDLDNDGQYDDLVTSNATEAVTWSTLYGLGVDDDGSYTIGLQVDDGNGGVVITSTTLTIVNVAPTLTATGAATVGGGVTYTLALTDVDPGNDTISSWIVNWGDGSIDTYLGDPSSVTHVYSNDLAGFTFEITVSAIDEDGQYYQADMWLPAYGGSELDLVQGYDGNVVDFYATGDGLAGHANVVQMANGNFLISGHGSNNVLQYQPDGTFVGTFVTAGSGGLSGAAGMDFGADGNLYVASSNTGKVLRFDGTTGAFIDEFVSTGLSFPLGLTFGPDGNLYVASQSTQGVLKFDGVTGALDATFNAPSTGSTEDITFGPDGNLYVSSISDGVVRLNGTTGAFIDNFVALGTGGLTSAAGVTFGPDGNLYVSDQNSNAVRRYDGTTGAYIDDYLVDGEVPGPAYMTFAADHQVTITNSNQSPTIATNTGDTVLEGSPGNVITTAMLNEGDPDDSGAGLEYTITSDVSHGAIRLGGVLLGLNDSFTQADIDAGLVTYDHDGSETTTDSFQFSLADGGENSSTPATGTFNFTITPVNDAPVITSNGGGASGAVNVAENTTTVTTVTSTDVDGGTAVYSISGGADSAKFNINSSTGALAFVIAPNYESPTDVGTDNVYDVQVTVSDGNGGTDTQDIAVTVTNVNEAPVITSNGGGATASTSAAENQTAVTTVTSTDVDGGTAVYSISGGADAAKFTINSSTGVLAFVSAPDYETTTDVGGNNVYDVQVTVSDGNGGTDVQDIAVTVTNVNEAPVITSNGGGATASTNIAENTTAVTTVTSTDVDGGTAVYSISGGADAAKFTINSATGVLAFVSAPDYESPTDVGGNNIYDVQVAVSDGLGGTDTQDLAVTVTNAQDTGQYLDQFTTASYSNNDGSLTWSTNWIESDTSGSGATGGNISIPTPNFRIFPNVIGDSITREANLAGANSSVYSFNLAVNNLSSGQIAVQISNNGGSSFTTLETLTSSSATGIHSFDISAYQAANTQIRFYVVATGSGGVRIDDVSISLDTNTSPTITSNGGGTNAAVSVAENTTAVTTVTATDPNVPGQTLTYLIAGGADAAKFTINSSTGALDFVSAPDYETPTDVGADNVYNVTVQVSDGVGGFDNQSIAVTVTNVNEAPVIANLAGDTLAYSEGDGAVAVEQSGDALVSDVDSGNLNAGTLTVSFSAGSDNVEDVLSVINQGTGAGQIGVSGSNVTYGGVSIGTFTGGSGGSSLVFTFNANATPAVVSALLKHISYLNTDTDSPTTGTRTVRYVLTDGDGGTSAAYDATINVTAVNDTPVVTAPGSAYSFTEQGSLNIHGTGFSVVDVDDNGGTMTATITVGEGRILIDAGDSGVSVTSGAFHTSGNSTDTVTFTGTVAQINALLTGASTGTIVYFHDLTVASDVPSASTTITLTVNDQGNTGIDPGLTGDGTSEEHFASQTINITAVNDSPEFIGPNLISNGTFDTDLTGWSTTGTVTSGSGRATFGSGGNAGPHTLSQTIATNVGDVYVLEFDYRDGHANLNQQLQVTVDGSSNLLTTEQILTDTDGSTFVGYRFEFVADSTSSTLTFTDTSDNAGSFSAATNGVDSAVDNISVRQVNGQLGTVAYTEDGPAVVLDSDVTLFDPEIGAALDDFDGTTLTLARNGGANGEDVFSATGNLVLNGGTLELSSVSIGSYTNAGGQLSIIFNATATSSQVNEVLQSIAYSNSNNTPPASVQIDWTFNDNNDGSQGTGGALDASGYTIVQITATNDAPVVANIEGTALSYTENDGAVAITSSISFTDVDDTNIESAVVQITGAYVNGEDVLAFVDQNGITGSWNAGTGELTLTGSATLAQYEAAIRSITYANGNENPDTTTRTVSFTVNDGDVDSNTQTRDITIGSVNDDPTNAGTLPADITVTEDVSSNIDLSALDLSDVDASSGSLTVKLTTSTGGNLAAAAGTGITIGGNGSGAITITGSLTDLNNYLNTASNVQYLHSSANLNGNDVDTINVKVNDNGNTGSGGGTDIDFGTVNVDIAAVNDEEVLATNTGMTVNEGSTTNVVTTAMLETTDVDNTAGQLIYTVGALPANGILRLNGSALGLNGTFTQADIDAGLVTYDHDNSETVSDSFSFSVDDGVGSFNSGTFNITVTPVNDNSITAIGDTDVAADFVIENVTVGTVVGVTAFADDVDGTDSVSYSLDDDAGGLFAIDSVTGVVTVNGAIDRETAASYNITVRAASTDTSSTTQVFTIAIGDVDEFDVGPVSDTNASANTVAENATVGTAVGITAFAEDLDATNNTITYTLDDDAGGLFAIDGLTGVVTVAGTLDYETATSHNITVRAASSDGSFSTQAFSINVTDVSESGVTAISDADGSADFVIENVTVGTVVGVTAFADDADGTDTVSYSLDDDAGGLFAIDSVTGVVTVNGAIDRETAASYNITVRATSTDTSSTTQVFTIAIGDVDEFDVGPVSDTNASANTVAENATVGTAVGITAFAEDLDATNNTITYTLDDDAGGLFAIDGVTGVVTVAGTLDYETAASHNITVRAASSDGSFSTQSFLINVTDVNESGVTAISDTDAAADFVLENASTGTVVGVTAFADDADGTDTVSYSLDDNAGGLFAIDSVTGIVTVAGSIDRETAASYNITVRATSTDTSATTRSFTIAIGDVDEYDVSTPTDTDGAINEVDENVAIGTYVGLTADAFDLDATNNTITYSLTSNPDGLFQIDANTGVVTTAAAIDRELHGATRSITVQATSSDGSTASQSFSITINDLDEYDVGPVSDANGSANTVAENATVGAAVGITAFAEDLDATSNTITYTLDDDAGGLFSIDGVTGVVTVAGTLDQETATSHNITVRASSSDGSFSTQVFLINVTDINESGITAISDTDAAADFVPENVSVGTVVGVTAFADDVDGTDTVSYSLDDDAVGLFAIDSVTGVVTVAGAIDRETAASYNITVRATSTDSSITTQVFTINIDDVDEFDVTIPTDINGTTNEVDENVAIGTTVGLTAYAFDLDATNNTITYSLTSNPDGLFQIDANTGVVTTAAAIDREVHGAARSITVQAASSDGSTAPQSFNITINDLDEYDVASLIDSDGAANTVSENASIGTTVGITSFTSDADATTNTITYTLDDSAGGLFAIDGNTGVVTVNAALDYETAASQSITVRATSADGSFATQLLTINVTDVNESGVTAISDNDGIADYVLENASNGTTVGITAFADDADGTDSVSYTLDDNAGGRFAIDGTTGVITLAGAIDREAAGTYNITIRATSTDTSTVTRIFTITIGDVDEFDVTAPVDTDASANQVNENATIGTTVGIAASASDADATTNGVTYSLFDNDGGRFTIDTSTGVVTVAGAIDREADGATRNITVRATSADGSTNDSVYTININDVDEFDVTAPVDTDASANQVNENATVGTTVGVQASASDADATTIGVTYSLFDNDGGRFAIDTSTGVVTIAGAIDREADGATRNITVRATSADGSTNDTVFTININDVDEFDVTTPVDTNAAVNTVAEDATVGTAVGITTFASDADATTNAITYSLDDNAGALFAIDGTTGVVTVAGGLDYETATSHNITVRATSADGSALTQVFMIAVTDVNESAVTAISDNDGIADYVLENASNGTTVGITAFADDADGTDSVSYTLDDNAGGRFAIDGTTGVITLAGAIDREAAGTYNITIRATSTDTSTVTRIFTITIGDVNEFTAGPVVDSNATANTVLENAAIGTTVGVTALASDTDATNNAIIYTLDNNAGGRFAVDGTTGIVTVLSALDYELATSHNITVRATSADGSFSTQSFTVDVTDVNDNAPEVTANQQFSVSELAGVGTVLGNVVATDVDTIGSLQGWTISGGNTDGVFVIDSATGTITIADATRLDFETTSSYSLTVSVSDGVNNSAPQSITVVVLDHNEAPKFSVVPTLSVNENTVNGTVIGSVAATDQDVAESLTYSIVSSSLPSAFAIDAVSGAIRVIHSTVLDYEAVSSVTLNLRVTDAAGLTDTQIVTISINDVNETPIDLVLSGGVVAENSTGGTLVGIVIGSDPDAGDVLHYALTSNGGGRFVIDAMTGAIHVAAGALLDYEVSSSHTVTVRTTDSFGLTYDESLTISVSNVNDAPVAKDDSYTALQMQKLNAVSGVLVNDHDEDGQQLITILVSGPSHGSLVLQCRWNVPISVVRCFLRIGCFPLSSNGRDAFQ